MMIIDYFTKQIVIKTPKYVRGIVYQDASYIELGWFTKDKIVGYRNINTDVYPDCSEYGKTLKKEFYNRDGCYRLVEGVDPEVEVAKPLFFNGLFPYTIKREYEAINHIAKIKKKVDFSDKTVRYKEAPFLKYSFGLEFETAAGYIPEDKCFKAGLIPLRDGSISGIEYSTIPLKGNKGLNLLKHQLELLKKYTIFNKDCSIHIHLGGFPVTEKAIFAFHYLWNKYQYNLLQFIPMQSYTTSNFKSNKKDYCKVVDSFGNFNSLYEFYTGSKYFGSLYMPHPNDIKKEAKWNVKTRYYNVNLINMLCYNSAKTIEFRFLTPTYSFEKLKTFLLLFTAILNSAETISSKYEKYSELLVALESELIDIRMLLMKFYPERVYKPLLENLIKLSNVRANQETVEDFNGSRLDLEYKEFPDGQ